MINRLPLSRSRARALVASGGALALFGCATAGASARAAQGVFEAGVTAEKAGRLAEAEKDFQLVLQQGGNTAFVHNNLGIVYQRRGDHLQAMMQFREAIRLQPEYFAPHALLGASLLATGKVLQAIRELERAVKLEPGQALTRLELAKAYERANNLAAALDQYQAVRELAPQDPECGYQLGQAYLKMAQWCERRMKRLDPQSPRIAECLAEAYRAQGRTAEAVRAFQSATRTDPRLPGIHLALAEIYLEERKLPEARQEIELELAIVPESLAAKAVRQRILSEEAKR
jgi:tetratricopeptide (TPR) repeat protein